MIIDKFFDEIALWVKKGNVKGFKVILSNNAIVIIFGLIIAKWTLSPITIIFTWSVKFNIVREIIVKKSKEASVAG